MPRSVPRAPQIRFRVDPAYAPADKVARRLHLTPTQFDDCKRRLYARGFPLPDETTGMYDLEGIDRWRMRQRPDLFPEIEFENHTPQEPRKDLGQLFREAHQRQVAERERLAQERREKRERLEQEQRVRRERRAKKKP